jgi:hypothetical protein
MRRNIPIDGENGEQIIYSQLITRAWNESNLSTEYKNWSIFINLYCEMPSDAHYVKRELRAL